MSQALTSVSAKLTTFAQRLGLKSSVPAEFRQRVAELELSFPRFLAPTDSIWWQAAPSLHELYELPRGALSGPVQEDKAQAHQALCKLIYRQQWELDAVDLRSINGLISTQHNEPHFSSLDAYNAAQCRHIRIIGINDLNRVLQGLDEGPWILNEASWRGIRLFWSNPAHNQAIASASAYARLRKLCIERSAVVNSYTLNSEGIAGLGQQFHVLCMPNHAWHHEAFMTLLVGQQLPYSRLSLQRGTQAGDCLILPKQHPHANTLGQGLLALGAEDFCEYLRRLPQ